MSHSSVVNFRGDLTKQLQFLENNITEILRQFPNFAHRNEMNDLIREYRYRVLRYLEGISKEGPDRLVWIGSTVKVQYSFDGTEDTYTLVFPHEMNLDEGRISFISPMGKRLLLSKVGDEVKIDSPSGTYELTIKELSYNI